ncbi:ICP22 family protein [Halosimplex salinum]|uniref:hypothetical protein n=1 Tax=Halosimplex salinum TaxID=1710538 RepID=UPI000F478239|nr:hypothetical protein [Halosimplex salinum]
MCHDLSLAVSKRPVVDGYAYPSVRLRVATDADEPVAVRVAESIPADVDEAAVGFHADEGYEHWSVADGGQIVYTNVVEPEKPVSTLYGVDAAPDRLIECLDAPAVEVARVDDLDATADADWTPLDDDRIEVTIDERAVDGDSRLADRQNSPAGGDWGDSDTTMNEDETRTTGETDVSELESGERDERAEQPRERDEHDERDEQEEPTMEAEGRDGTADQGADDGESDGFGDGEPAESDGEPGVLTRGGSAERDQIPATADRQSGPDASSAGTPVPDTPTQPEPHDSVVEQFAEELRRDEPSSQAVATLRSHLAPDTSGSVDAKLDHCLTRIGELNAYVDALEAFLDEEGSAEQLLSELRDELRAAEARIDDVTRRVESVETAQSKLDDRLSSVESELDELSSALETVDEFDESLRETRVELTDAVEEVETDVSTLEDDLRSVEQWRSTVVDALSGAEGVGPANPDGD